MTVVLTVLIWVSADSLVNEAASMRVSLEVLPPLTNPDMLIETDAETTSCEMEISGPRKIIDDVQAQAPLLVRLRIPERPTGRAAIPLEEMLKKSMAEQWHEFRKLSITSVEPEVLHVNVDHMVTKDVEVVAGRLTLAYDMEPQLPRTPVSVRMRESHYNTLPPGQRLQIDIGPDIERLLKEQPAGKSVTIPVTLDARQFGPDAVVTPNACEITATVQAQRSTAQIPTVPILLAVSFANLERTFRPATRDGSPLSLVTQTITVAGLTEDVQRLQRGETRVYGIIQLKQEDLEALDVLKLVTPEYHLPKGIELADEPTPIEFKLIYVTNNGTEP